MDHRRRSIAFLFVAFFILLLCLVFPPSAGAGGVFISGDDADDVGHCQGRLCGGLYPRVLRVLYGECQPVPDDRAGILAIGVNGDTAEASLRGWNLPVNGGPGAPLAFARTPEEIAGAVFEHYRILYLPSDAVSTPGGITPEQLAALNARQADVQHYINEGNGRLLALTEEHLEGEGAFGWLPNPLTFEEIGEFEMVPTPALAEQFPGSGATDRNLDHCCYHNDWTGPAGFSGLKVLVVSQWLEIPDPLDSTQMIAAPVILGGCNVRVSREVCGNGVDDDEDGQVDEADRDCQVCGDGSLDPGEQCDDGNLLGGDGCSQICRREGSSQPPVCNAGGPYTVECRGGKGELTLDATASFDPEGQPLDYTWSSDCPAAVLADAAAMQSTLTVGGSPCHLACKVSLDVSDPDHLDSFCDAPVVVADTLAPAVQGCALSPLAPLPPRDPASPCSQPRSQALAVDCGAASDLCDAAPRTAVRLFLTRFERGDRDVCFERTYEIPVACGETLVRVEPTPRCPARSPRPQPLFRLDAAGRKVIEGDLRLEVQAVDHCGNASPPCRAQPAGCGPGAPVPLAGRTQR